MVNTADQVPKQQASFDPYAVLGLSRQSSADDIKTAYKRLALKHHPDKPGGNAYSFSRLNEAYQILSDPDKRKMYDSCYDDSINLDVLYKFASVLMNIVHKKIQERLGKQSPHNERQDKDGGFEHKPSTKDNHYDIIKAPSIIVKMTVDIQELYNAEVKKLVVKVKRRCTSASASASAIHEQCYKSIPLYISLLEHQKKYMFAGVGDDGASDNIQRGDIIVYVNIESKVIETASLDTLFCEYDVHIERSMNLYEYLYGVDVEIPYFNGETIPVQCRPFNKNAGDYYSHVHVVKGKGLPYAKNYKAKTEFAYCNSEGGQSESESESESPSATNSGRVIVRGDLYIYFKLVINRLDEEVMKEHENFFKTYFNAAP